MSRILAAPDVEVVSTDVLNMDVAHPQQEVLWLRTRVQKLIALPRVLLVVLKISRFSLNHSRRPNGDDKRFLLRAIERIRLILPLRCLLRLIRLSPSRHHLWSRKDGYRLDDVPSCQRNSPHQLTDSEIETIRDLITSHEYRHVPTGTLAILSQRIGKVCAWVTTWYPLVRNHQWRRPRQRVHLAKPKIGIQASRPNEIWHIDTTLIRMLDGCRARGHERGAKLTPTRKFVDCEQPPSAFNSPVPRVSSRLLAFADPGQD